MPHHTPLIATLVAGLVLAFIFGALVQRIRIPPLVGYLLAGVVIGPFTPGHGRVGSFISAALPAGTSVLVIEDDTERSRR